MSNAGVFKRIVVPSTLIGAAIVAEAIANDTQERRDMRPSELPIYTSECAGCKTQPSVGSDPSALETQIGVLRKEVWVWHDKFKGVRKEVTDVCVAGYDKSQVFIGYLQEENNYLPRWGVVALMGLNGWGLGIRGGKVKKISYSVGMMLYAGAVLYPTQCDKVLAVVAHWTKRGVKIGYNFVYGVKPDYLKLPDPATFMPDTGADVKAPPPQDGVAKPSLLDTVKASLRELTGQPEPATEPLNRDQSTAADKNMYPARQ